MAKLTIKRGETLALRIRARDASGAEVAIPHIYTAEAMLRTNPQTKRDVLDLDPVVSEGTANIEVPTSGIAPGNYQFDLKLRDEDGHLTWSEKTYLEVLEPGTKP